VIVDWDRTAAYVGIANTAINANLTMDVPPFVKIKVSHKIAQRAD
jgi:hypothetical protein